MQAFLSLYLDTYCLLAKRYQVTIILGSFPEKIKMHQQDCFVNRSYVAHPDGHLDFQDKQIMTRFETEDWLIRAGTEIKVLNTAVGRIGISICYDSEFPLLARKQSESGAEIILVPSVTETMHGYFRVKIGSQARALENQCYVVHASLVGEALWAPALEQCYGRAGIYTPVDQGFPSDGILAQGELNTSMWVYADLDLAKTKAVRTHGNVLNYRDWDYQQQRIAV
jgi:predicted amidohydrolase